MLILLLPSATLRKSVFPDVMQRSTSQVKIPNHPNVKSAISAHFPFGFLQFRPIFMFCNLNIDSQASSFLGKELGIARSKAEMDSTTPFIGLFAALSYGISSMTMVFINKAIIMQYTYSMTLLTFQQLATAVIIHLAQVMGDKKPKRLNVKTTQKLLPLSVFYNANVAFGLTSLKGVNIPMYIALKRLTPLAVLVAGSFSGKGRPSTQVSLSVVLVAVGVIIAALGDFSFDLFGYCMALTSVFFQTMYLVLVEKSGGEDGLSSLELMLYNSLLSLPFLLFLIIVTGEVPKSLALLLEKANSLSFLVILVLSLAMGMILNYTMFFCTIVNSALTTTIVGVLKGVGSTALGFVLLGGVQVRALNVTGLVINTAGGVWYSYMKYQLKKTKQRKVPRDAEAHHR